MSHCFLLGAGWRREREKQLLTRVWRWLAVSENLNLHTKDERKKRRTRGKKNNSGTKRNRRPFLLFWFRGKREGREVRSKIFLVASPFFRFRSLPPFCCLTFPPYWAWRIGRRRFLGGDVIRGFWHHACRAGNGNF